MRPKRWKTLPRLVKFQSTHSLRSATTWFCIENGFVTVSIHALLAECDTRMKNTRTATPCFNPRTPCGVRRFPSHAVRRRNQFQSTHSLRSATCVTTTTGRAGTVSIHALLAECDWRFNGPLRSRKSFNPRTPCGVRLTDILRQNPALMFQSTHSLRSATAPSLWALTIFRVSIHALLAECDIINRSRGEGMRVSIHALLAECDRSAVSLLNLL